MTVVATVVVPIIQPLINKLSSGVWREMERICCVEKELGKLKRLLETINNVLEDAKRRSVTDVTVRDWLRDINDAAFDANKVVDDFQTVALHRQSLSIIEMVRNFFSSNNPFLFRYKMAHKIKDVSNRFDELAQRRRNFQLE